MGHTPVKTDNFELIGTINLQNTQKRTIAETLLVKNLKQLF